jgi:hypothetical protein
MSTGMLCHIDSQIFTNFLKYHTALHHKGQVTQEECFLDWVTLKMKALWPFQAWMLTSQLPIYNLQSQTWLTGSEDESIVTHWNISKCLSLNMLLTSQMARILYLLCLPAWMTQHSAIFVCVQPWWDTLLK